MKHFVVMIHFLVMALGCGVKGRPLPPETQPVLGRGEPSFTKATQNLQLDPKKKKKIIDDWEDSSDFKEERE